MYRFNKNNNVANNNVPRALPHLLDTDYSNRVITDYRIRGLAYLDCGTYGQVYRIHQADRPEESVLKVIAAQDSSEAACRGMIEEAKNEAELVECLDHPNIVKLIMSKAYPNPFQPRIAGYFTMQFEMCKISLDKFVLDCMGNGTLGNRFLIENLIKQIGGALKYMHELRFVHHDIKPDNIMVVNDQVPFRALHFKLIDFGLAQTYSFDTPLESTSDRRFAGTEWYMCQEKLACHPRYTGPVLPYNPYLADVYAFGVTCLECALGFEEQVPNDPQYNSRDETLLRQLAKIPQANHLSEPIRLKLLKMLWKHEKDRSHMHEILE